MGAQRCHNLCHAVQLAAELRLKAVGQQVNAWGSRIFWVLSVGQLLQALQQDPSLSLYEVLSSGDRCRVYLDLEYDRALNPDRDAAMDEEAVQLVVASLQRVLDQPLHTAVRLDASDQRKFSQHLLLTVPGSADGCLGSPATVGEAVRAAIAGWERHAQLIVCGPQGPRCLCDSSVYKMNQQFRVMFSSKFGQQRPLLPVGGGLQLATCNEAAYTAALVAPCAPAPSSQSLPAAVRSVPAVPAVVVCAAGVYPHLIDFLNAQLPMGAVTAVAMHRTQPLQQPYLYCATSSRWCDVAGRCHGSNHVMLHVNAATARYRAMCLHPACAAGPWLELPPGVFRQQPATPEWAQWHQAWIARSL